MKVAVPSWLAVLMTTIFVVGLVAVVVLLIRSRP